MTLFRSRNEHGFSLVEILIATGLSTVVLAGVTVGAVSGANVLRINQEVSEARAASNLIATAINEEVLASDVIDATSNATKLVLKRTGPDRDCRLVQFALIKEKAQIQRTENRCTEPSSASSTVDYLNGTIVYLDGPANPNTAPLFTFFDSKNAPISTNLDTGNLPQNPVRVQLRITVKGQSEGVREESVLAAALPGFEDLGDLGTSPATPSPTPTPPGGGDDTPPGGGGSTPPGGGGSTPPGGGDDTPTPTPTPSPVAALDPALLPGFTFDSGQRVVETDSQYQPVTYTNMTTTFTPAILYTDPQQTAGAPQVGYSFASSPQLGSNGFPGNRESVGPEIFLGWKIHAEPPAGTDIEIRFKAKGDRNDFRLKGSQAATGNWAYTVPITQATSRGILRAPASRWADDNNDLQQFQAQICYQNSDVCSETTRYSSSGSGPDPSAVLGFRAVRDGVGVRFIIDRNAETSSFHSYLIQLCSTQLGGTRCSPLASPESEKFVSYSDPGTASTEVTRQRVTWVYSDVSPQTRYWATLTIVMGESSASSGRRTLTRLFDSADVGTGLATPSNLRANDIKSQNADFNWDAVVGAGYYNIIQGDQGTLDEHSSAIELGAIKSNSTMTAISTTEPSARERVYVQACKPDGNCSGWASLWIHTSPKEFPPSSSLTFPDRVTSTGLRVAWPATIDANTGVQYKIEVIDTNLKVVHTSTRRHPDTTGTIAGLTPNTLYRVNVTACNVYALAEENTCNTPIYALFTTGAPHPAAPSLVWVNNVKQTSATVNWAPVENASYYLWRVNGVSLWLDTTATSVNVDFLNGANSYTAEVKACSSGGCSEAAATQIATRPAPPSGFTAKNVTDSGATLDWVRSGQTNIVSTLRITSIGYDRTISAIPATDSFRTVSLPNPGTTYNATLETCNTYNTDICAQATTSFTTMSGAPTGIRANAEKQTTANIVWDATPGATSYQVRVQNSAGSNMENTAGITTTSHGASGLSAAESYTVQVRACNTDGCGTWSTSIGFGTIPGPLASMPVPSGQTQTSVTVSWGVANGANVTYHAGFDGFTYTNQARSRTFTNLTNSKTYVATVKPCNTSYPALCNSPSSSAPIELAPSTPSFSLSASSEPRIQISNVFASGAANYTYFLSGGATRGPYTTPTNTSWTSASINTTYTVSVRACNRDGICTASSKNITVPAPTYTCPSGYTLNGTNCVSKYTATSATTYTCPSGYTRNGTSCTRTVSGTSTTLCSTLRTNFGNPPGWTCTRSNGRSSYSYTQTISATANVTLSCPQGGTRSGSTCTITQAATLTHRTNFA